MLGAWTAIALVAVAGVIPLEAARVPLLTVALAAAATWVVRRLQSRRLSARRVVLVGNQHEVEAYAAAGLGQDVVAGCLVRCGEAVRTPTSLIPTTSSLEALPELVSRVRADAILVLPGVDVTAAVVRDLTWLFEHSPVTVGVVCPVSSVSAHRLRTTLSGPNTVLELGKPRATAGARLAKGLVDRLGAVLLLLVTSPLLLVLWAAVRLDSPGPGFHVVTRTGRDGERFDMVRLRTMHHGAGDLPDTSAPEDEVFSIRRDPRVTRVGYWLRRFSLDELPQLYQRAARRDVARRSAAGPPDEAADYDAVSRRRLVVKPGITGLWQVSGHSDLLWDESLRLDLYYADNWRLVDDLRIAARSVVGASRARGAD